MINSLYWAANAIQLERCEVGSEFIYVFIPRDLIFIHLSHPSTCSPHQISMAQVTLLSARDTISLQLSDHTVRRSSHTPGLFFSMVGMTELQTFR